MNYEYDQVASEDNEPFSERLIKSLTRIDAVPIQPPIDLSGERVDYPPNTAMIQEGRNVRS